MVNQIAIEHIALTQELYSKLEMCFEIAGRNQKLTYAEMRSIEKLLKKAEPAIF